MEENAILVSAVSKSFKTYKQSEDSGIVGWLSRKKYTKHALNGVSFGIKRGEIVALLGKNGSGKSTLIKIITGIVYPDKGHTEVMDLNSWEERAKATQHIGVVLGAHGQLFWNLPPLDTFNFIRSIYRIPEREYKRRLNYFLDILELREVYTRQVRSLSLGEQMKCNFVASMLQMPDIVILDEPTIGVDVPSKAALRNTILDLNRKYRTTFLMTTHIIEDITIANRIIMLDGGKVIFDGSKSKLERFFGDKRTVELSFDAEPKLLNLKRYGKIIERGKFYAKLEVERKLLKTAAFIDLLEDKSVVDYTVSEPSLTSIISRFYGPRKKSKSMKEGI